MSTSESINEAMNDLNNLAEARGCRLKQHFWEIPRSPGTIFDRIDAPDVAKRVQKVREYIRTAKHIDAEIQTVLEEQDIERSLRQKEPSS